MNKLIVFFLIVSTLKTAPINEHILLFTAFLFFEKEGIKFPDQNLDYFTVSTNIDGKKEVRASYSTSKKVSEKKYCYLYYFAEDQVDVIFDQLKKCLESDSWKKRYIII